jgi:hypothetical protein
MWGYKRKWSWKLYQTTTITMLATFNLTGTVHFQTRITNGSISAIDNICIDKTRNYSINPFINGMSDHDTQVITLKNIFLQKRLVYETQYLRSINRITINRFPTKLSYETWNNIFEGSDVNIILSNFLNTYLRTFYSSFIKKKITFNHKYNPWITTVIRILCNEKKELCLKYSVRNISNLKLYCKQYCNIWSKVIKAAKKKTTLW